MYRKFLPLIFGLLAAGFLACDNEQFEKPIPQIRFFNRFVNLNHNAGAVDVRLNSTEGLEWLGLDLTFEESKPGQGYGSVLVNVDTFARSSTNRDTSQYLFYEVIGHRSKEMVIRPLELGALGEGIGRKPQSFYLVDSFRKPILTRLPDDFDSPKGGRAGIRFVNMNYNFVSISLEIKGDTLVIPRKNFLNSSRFYYPKAETRTIYLKNDLTRQIVDSIPNVPLRPGRVYDFYFTHKNNEPVSGYHILK